ncbi:MAG: flagellar basal body rod protein FlgC [Myxococcota bacterium]
MELLKSLQISAAGMTAERTRLTIVSANIANANATRSADGSGPYKRRLPVLESETFDRVFTREAAKFGDQEVKVPLVVDVQLDETPGATIYDPSHPDADENGYVTMPNVNIVSEMVDMMHASRAYEANLNAIDATRDMTLKSLEIGRG